MGTSGTRWTQIKVVDRKGDGTQGQSFGGGATSDRDVAIYDADGNVIASDISIDDVLISSGGPGSPYQEVPIGVMDGVNATFHTTFIPIGLDAVGRVPVWIELRGIDQHAYIDFTMLAGSNEFTMAVAPQPSDKWIIKYFRGAAGTPPPSVPAIESAELSVWASHTASGGSSSIGNFMQGASGIAGGTITSTTVESIAATFGGANTAGNTIIVWVFATCAGSGCTVDSPSVTDSLGNSYTQAFWVPTGNANGSAIGLFYATNVLAGANTLTFSYTATSDGSTTGFEKTVMAGEYSGMLSPAVQASTSYQVVGFAGNNPLTLTVSDSFGVAVSVTIQQPGPNGSNGIGDNTGFAIADLLIGGVNYIVAAALAKNASVLDPTTSPTGYQGFTQQLLASDATNGYYGYYWDAGAISVSGSRGRITASNADNGQSSILTASDALYGLTEFTATLPIPTRAAGVNSYAGYRVEFALDSNGTQSGNANALNIYDVFIMLRLRDGSTQVIRPSSYTFWSGSQGGVYAWQPATNYAAGATVVDSNGNLQTAASAGTSGSDPGPTWATSGTTSDNGIPWNFAGAQTSTTGQIADPALAFDGDADPPTTFATLSRSHFGSLSTSGLFTVLFGGGATVNPTVLITSPLTEDGVTGTITLSVTATAVSPASMASVEFKIDGVHLDTESGAGPTYSTTWDTTLETPGSHVISAIALDSLGQTTTATETVTVATASNAPAVAFTAPVASTYSGTIDLSVTATAVGPATMTQVEFKVDGAHLATVTGAGPIFATTLDTTGLSDANHAISAIATDSATVTHEASVSITTSNSGGGGSVDTSHDFTTALSDGGFSLLEDRGFGTGGNVTNLSDLAALFDPYGYAGTTPFGGEWERYQPFNTANFVFTASSLDLKATIPVGGGLWPGGINSGQLFSKTTYVPGRTGHAAYAFEVRMKIPGAQGSFPASWLYTKFGTNPNPSPSDGGGDGSEIDNPEYFNSDPSGPFQWTGYTHGPGAGADFYSRLTNPPYVWQPGTDFSAGYHNYQLVWMNGKIYRYVDGLLIRATDFAWTASGLAQFIVNLAVGSGLVPGLVPTSLGDFPMVLSIEHIKVWGA